MAPAERQLLVNQIIIMNALARILNRDPLWRSRPLRAGANHALADNFSPIGPDDTAGVSQWDLGALPPGMDMSITIYQDAIGIPTPESIGLTVIAVGVLVLGILNFRRELIMPR